MKAGAKSAVIASTATSETSTVLIVDDTESAVEVMRGVLEGQGYHLVIATSGPEALKKAEEVTPDVILLDVMMPGMDGFEVCKRLRETAGVSDIPVVMITALDDRNSKIRGIEAGADEFLSKPFDRNELRARVRTITQLNRHRLLLAERSRVEALIHLSPDGIMLLDEQGVIRLASPAMARLLREEDEASLVGRSVWQFLDPAAEERCQAFFTRILTGDGDTGQLETVFRRTDGDTFVADVSAGPFPWDDVPTIELIVRDVSDRKRLEETIHRSQRLDAMARATAGVVHDFNNMLQAIQVSAEVAKMEVEKAGLADSPVVADLEEILGATRDAADLAKRLLTFAREQSVEMTVLDLCDVVRDTEAILTRVVGKKVGFELTYPETELMVTADRTQLKQVLMNLVVNARDATPDGGSITVGFDQVELDERFATQHSVATGHHVVLEICDTGQGMDQETLDRIFEPFFTTKGEGEGTGLGLAVIHGIVARHEGAVTVDSQPGEGTTFRIYLPAADAVT